MRIILTTAVWGRAYCETFVRFSLASLLAPGNLPALLASHDVTLHVVTTRRDRRFLERSGVLEKFAVVWDAVAAPRGEKYSAVSRLQNLAFARSVDYDVIVFNYPDFVWADGALLGAVDALEGAVAVSTFVLPVEDSTVRGDLEFYRFAGLLEIPPRRLVAIVLRHLHLEAKLRFWNGPQFTAFPSYLIWDLAGGLLVRAYHQTVLALRVEFSEEFAAGMSRGTLDGYYTAELADRGKRVKVVGSSTAMVCSLHDAPQSSLLRPGIFKEHSLHVCLHNYVSEGQRRYALEPIRVQAFDSDERAWQLAELESRAIVDRFALVTPPGRELFDAVNAWPVEPPRSWWQRLRAA